MVMLTLAEEYSIVNETFYWGGVNNKIGTSSSQVVSTAQLTLGRSAVTEMVGSGNEQYLFGIMVVNYGYVHYDASDSGVYFYGYKYIHQLTFQI
jgi:hypothetical protein